MLTIINAASMEIPIVRVKNNMLNNTPSSKQVNMFFKSVFCKATNVIKLIKIYKFSLRIPLVLSHVEGLSEKIITIPEACQLEAKHWREK